MLLSNKTVDGKDISNLKRHSRRCVFVKCDSCGAERTIAYQDFCTKRLRKENTKHSGKDYCFDCSMKNMNVGEGNPAKRLEVGEKISSKIRGKSKKFKDGINPRRLQVKVGTNGYILEWDDNKVGHRPQHRLVVEKSIGRELLKNEKIHHIDCNKSNNVIENLYICSSTAEHSKLHNSFMKLINYFMTLGLIGFDKEKGEYYPTLTDYICDLPPSLDFDDVYIIQGKNVCASRMDTDISSEVIRGIIRPIPLMASNMYCVTNSEFCIRLFELGALGIMHRADSPDRLKDEIKAIADKCDVVCASIGITEDQKDLARLLVSNGANVIFVDVAHGYSDAVLEMGRWIKKEFSSIRVIVGNTTNIKLAYECDEFADAIKVGLANGLACETATMAGCTEGQFTSVLKFREISKKLGLPIISDGGIRKPADFVKAIGAGASSVMAGSIFARCLESAAPVIYDNGQKKRLYSGMASRYIQDKWRGGLKPGTCPEGRTVYLDPGEGVVHLLERYSGALRSGITYAGVQSCSELKIKAVFGKHYTRPHFIDPNNTLFL